MIRQLQHPSKQHLKIGLTGLSRSGKTVFLTSLIHNLLMMKNLPLFSAMQQDVIQQVMLQHQADDALPRFAYEQYLDQLLQPEPVWPEGTKNISQIRLAIRYQTKNWLLQQVMPHQTLILDIIDYPGEWLLDLPLLEMDFANWSNQSLMQAKTAQRHSFAKPWLDALQSIDVNAPYEERMITVLAHSYTEFLHALREKGEGLFDLPPGRFLLPGDLKNAPILTFCPLPVKPHKKYPKNSYGDIMARRFESYKKHVVKPFFRQHFSRIQRQVVLIDPLSALDNGIDALHNLSYSMESVLNILKPRAHSMLFSWLLGQSMDKVLFAATKADHIHHSQHKNLLSLMQSLLPEALRKARFAGMQTMQLALAAMRCTVELEHKDGRGLVQGRMNNQGTKAVFTGEVPKSLAAAKEHEFLFSHFLPVRLEHEHDAIPHIRMDQALEFLLKDQFR